MWVPTREFAQILIEIALSRQGKRGRTGIVIISRVPVYERGLPLHFFLDFIHQSFVVFSQIVHIYFFVKFIPKYFILRGANINGIVFFISNSTCFCWCIRK